MLTRIVETATDPTGKFVEIDMFAAPATAWTFEPRPPQHIPNDQYGSSIHENVGLAYGEPVFAGFLASAARADLQPAHCEGTIQKIQ
jgi:hypothetical protein